MRLSHFFYAIKSKLFREKTTKQYDVKNSKTYKETYAKLSCGFSETANEVSTLAAEVADLLKKDEDIHIGIKQVNLFRDVLDRSSDQILLADYSGNIVYVNKAFCLVKGYTLKELLGQNVKILKSYKHDNEFYRNMTITTKQGSSWCSEIINRTKDNVFLEEILTILPIMNCSDTPIYYFGIIKSKHDK